MKTIILTISLIFVLAFANLSYSQNNINDNYLTIGTEYTFCMGETYKISGILISMDSVYYTVNSDNGRVKFKKTEVTEHSGRK